VREMIDWIRAEADRVEDSGVVRRRGRFSHDGIEDLPAHSFPGRDSGLTTEGTEGHGGNQNPGIPGLDEIENPSSVEEVAISEESWEEERERRIYRARTVTMLRRYMRYSIETGRLPSLLGREFFRTRVTSYTLVTFEDRVIFVHDMETSLNKLDEFSRQIIARHILQEHDQAATARLLGCAERTVRSYVPIALDLMSEILLDVGLLERIVPIREKTCQGGKTGENFVSGYEESKNKF
jgi:DNA-directed RNA polymerase specialized sigma24 family protein